VTPLFKKTDVARRSIATAGRVVSLSANQLDYGTRSSCPRDTWLGSSPGGPR
jgi:hypothetical protein